MSEQERRQLNVMSEHDACPYCGAWRWRADHLPSESCHYTCGTSIVDGVVRQADACKLDGYDRLKAENERLKVEIADMKRSVQLMSMANQVMRNDLKLAQEKRETAWDEVEHLRSRLQRYEAVVETLKDGVNTLLTTNPNQDLINDALEVLADLEVSNK